MTPLEVITQARRLNNAVSDTFWSDDELYGYLLDCAMILATQTDCIENRYTTTSVASQQEYEKPTRMIKVVRLEYDSVKLKPITLRQLDALSNNSATTVTGTPTYYYWFDNVFGLFPVPDTAGDTIKTYSIDYPSTPSATSTLEVPVQYHWSLVQGVRAYMSSKELGHPNTVLYQRLWNDAIDWVMREERRRRRGDSFARVLREEDLPATVIGAQ